MRDQADKLAFLEALEKAGVKFSIHLLNGYGWTNVTPANVLEYAKDPEVWRAKRHGVTVEHLRAFIKWMEADFPCYGITRKGTHCKLSPDWNTSIEPIRNFQPGVSEYCDYHLGQSALHQQRRNTT